MWEFLPIIMGMAANTANRNNESNSESVTDYDDDKEFVLFIETMFKFLRVPVILGIICAIIFGVQFLIERV